MLIEESYKNIISCATENKNKYISIKPRKYLRWTLYNIFIYGSYRDYYVIIS